MKSNELSVNCFKAIYNEHFDQLRRYIYYRCGDEDLATDISQDAYLKLWEHRNNVVKETILEFLYTIARNLHTSIYRKDKMMLEFKKAETYKSEQQNVENEFYYNETKKKFEVTLLQMSEKQREVFLMSRMDGLKYLDIAERLGISVKSVEKRMTNALSFLRKQLQTET